MGKLDQLHHSKRMFTIRTDDGQDLRGVLANDDTAVDSLAPLFGQRAQVAGIAKFRASGTLWLIEADAVAPAAPGASPLSKAPKPLFPALDARSLHKSQGPKSGVAAVFGRWPGDETDSEIEDLLAENS
ncbi:MAG TPA: hypothetical protein VH374_01460 [Polyangia bacterium]|nr:hypothetical protein [Polyangia bacterium]